MFNQNRIAKRFNKNLKWQVLYLALGVNLFNNSALYSMEDSQNSLHDSIHNSIHSIEYNQNIINDEDENFHDDNQNIINEDEEDFQDNNQNVINIEDEGNIAQINRIKRGVKEEVDTLKQQYENFHNTFNIICKNLQDSNKSFENLITLIQKQKQNMINATESNIKKIGAESNKDIILLNDDLKKYNKALQNFTIIPQRIADKLYNTILLIRNIKTSFDNKLSHEYNDFLKEFLQYSNNINIDFDQDINERIPIQSKLHSIEQQIFNLSHDVNKLIVGLQSDSYSLVDQIKNMITDVKIKAQNQKDNIEEYIYGDMKVILQYSGVKEAVIDFLNSVQNIQQIPYYKFRTI